MSGDAEPDARRPTASPASRVVRGGAGARSRAEPHGARAVRERRRRRGSPGTPGAGLRAELRRLADPGARADRLVLRRGRRARRPTPPARRRRGLVRLRPVERAAHDAAPATSDDVWRALPTWDWQPLGRRQRGGLRDRRRSTEDVVMVGSGSVDLWLRSTRQRHRPAGDARARSGPTARRSTCRTAGCAPAAASSTRRARPSCGRCRRTSRPTPTPLPAGEFVLARVELLPVRARLPRRLAHPHRDRGAGRRPRALEVRRAAERGGDGDQHDRARSARPVARRAAGGARRRGRRRRCRRAPACARSRAGTYEPTTNGG